MIKTEEPDEISINQMILNTCPTAIVTIDDKGKPVYFNAEFLTTIGYTADQIAKVNAKDLFPEWKEIFVNNNLPTSGQATIRFKRLQGSLGVIKLSYRKILINNTSFISLFIFQDNQTTLNNHQPTGVLENSADSNNCYLELQRTNNVLKMLNQQLEDSLASRRTFFDNAGLMLFNADKAGLIQIFNIESEKLLGYSKEEVINRKKIDSLFCDGCIDEMKKTYRQFIKSDDNIDIIQTLVEKNILKEKEVKLKRKNGTEFPASLTITLIHNNHQQIIGYMGFASDLTQRKNIEQKLLDALEKEKQLGEMKTRFVTIASHEFRTPLSTILSSAYLTAKYHKTEDQYKRDRHLNRIISAVNTLSDMLNDFLNLGKIEEGKITMKITEFDIKETFSLVIHDIKTNAKKGQSFYYQHFGIDVVQSDPSLIRNILLNLISNAIKFSPENGIINIKSFVENEWIIFHVEDNGIGISDSDKQQITEKFFRGSNASHIQGTGLGLHIVTKYIERLKGKLECHSELNKGTTFKIILPTKNKK